MERSSSYECVLGLDVVGTALVSAGTHNIVLRLLVSSGFKSVAMCALYMQCRAVQMQYCSARDCIVI